MVPPLRYRAEVVKALRPCLCPIWGRSGREPSPTAAAPRSSWLIIFNPLGLFLTAVSSLAGVRHATFLRTSCQCLPACRLGRFRRQPRLHRCQPGGWLWRRRVPGQGREMRRPCRPLLLPVTGICTGHRLSPRRSRRDHRRGSERCRRQMRRPRLRRIRRHYLPALEPDTKIPGGRLPHLRPGNDVTLPREAAIGCGLGRRMPPWPRDWAFEPRGKALNGRICWKFATRSPFGF